MTSEMPKSMERFVDWVADDEYIWEDTHAGQVVANHLLA
jgi:hypothetical protein